MEKKAVLTVAAAVSLALMSLAHAGEVVNLSNAASKAGSPVPPSKAPGTVAAPAPASLSYLQPTQPAKATSAPAPAAPAPVATKVQTSAPTAATAAKPPAEPPAAQAAKEPTKAVEHPKHAVVRRPRKAVVPVVVQQPLALPGTFDLSYSGDIWRALQLLSAKRPQLMISAQGTPFPLVVHLELKGADLIEALRAIGDQTGTAADLVFNNATSELRIVYKAPAATVAAALEAPAPLMGTVMPVERPAPKPRPGPAVSPAEESRNWQAGGTARPIMGQDGLLQFPFGQTQPSLTCEPLRACDIQLQAGEIINNVILGDTNRWLAAPASTGTGNQATPHVIVKPTENGMVTNLIITTNRRTYMLTLKSDAGQYVSRVGFYYPQDIVQDWNGQIEAERRKTDEDAARKVADLPISSIDQLNLDAYRLKGDRSLPWYPVRVFDDGTHVWIQMPPSIKSSEAPAMVLEDKSGKIELVNYRVKPAQQGGVPVTYYIVDKLFTKGALIVGVGSDQQKVEIIRNNKNASVWGGFDN